MSAIPLDNLIEELKAQKLYYLGKEAFKKKEFLIALEHFNFAIHAYPDDEHLLLNQALTYMQLNNYKKAFNIIEKTLQINSNNVECYLILGFINSAEGKYSKAKEILLKGLKISPYDYSIHKLLGEVYLNLEDFANADEEFKMLLKANSSDDIVHYKYAYSLALQGEVEKAEIQYVKAIEISISNASYWNDLGLLYFFTSKNELAEECFIKALTIDNDNVHSRVNLGIILLKKGHYYQSIQHFNSALAIDNNNYKGHFYLGIAHEHLENFALAKGEFELAIDIFPESEEVAQHLEIVNFLIEISNL